MQKKKSIISVALLSLLLLTIQTEAQQKNVVKSVNGTGYILHKVTPKQTWFELSRIYELSLEELMEANPGVIELKINQIVQIPSRKSSLAVDPNPVLKSTTEIVVSNDQKNKFHIVLAGESLYGISKRYNQSITDLKMWNALESDQISVGQSLVVGYIHNSSKTIDITETASKVEQKETMSKEVLDSKEPEYTRSIEKPDDHKSVYKVNESGVAAWIEETEVNPNKYYALHKTAPLGSIVKVTNRMNQRSVYVKVIGMLPDTGDNHGLLIKVSKAAASKMGVLDPRFQVDLSYGIYENEKD
ncbi:MAG TPA: LysM peptidoglycan-binding domain-containing protein [Bacteroidia bacterium]|nr:LysM peptidoglycan-binding domain-containing protein [Bacteroidia bacterium]HNT79944.1 LysM peptidoglycan-binding domain-containing protein [Bacteroidia bacterium]